MQHTGQGRDRTGQDGTLSYLSALLDKGRCEVSRTEVAARAELQ